MRANWKECQYIERYSVPWAGLYVTLTRYGEIRFGKRTYERMGEPKALQVYFDAANNRFGLKAAHLEARNAFPVRPKGTGGGRLIRILGVLKENRIEIPETIRFFDADFDDEGILVLDLRTARIPKSVRGHPRNIARAESSSDSPP